MLKKKKGTEKVFRELMAQFFPNLMKAKIIDARYLMNMQNKHKVHHSQTF